MGVYRICELRFRIISLAEFHIYGKGNRLAVIPDTYDFVDVDIGGSGYGNTFCRKIFLSRHSHPVKIGAFLYVAVIFFGIDVSEFCRPDCIIGFGIGGSRAPDRNRSVFSRFEVDTADIYIYGGQFRLLLRHIQIKGCKAVVSRDVTEGLSGRTEGTERKKSGCQKHCEQNDKCPCKFRQPAFSRSFGCGHILHKGITPLFFPLI